MMHHRRIVSSELSSDIVGFLLHRGHTQSQIAKILGVSAPFVSLVKNRERSLTLDHVERLHTRLGIPLGEFFIALAGWSDGTPLKTSDPYVKDMKQSDR